MGTKKERHSHEQKGSRKRGTKKGFFLFFFLRREKHDNISIFSSLKKLFILTIFTPLVLLADLLFLLRAEIVLNVEDLADFFGTLALDDISNRFAGNIEKLMNIKIVGSEDKLENGVEINFAELLIPSINRLI